MNRKLHTALIGGVSLVAITAVGTVWATSSAAAQSRYVTAVVGTGDVSQSFLATGTVSRQNLVDAGFSVTGTVKKLAVDVGDQVAAGDLLATLDTTALKLELLNAQTDLASAKATLYAAEHPSSTSSGSRGTGLPSGGSNAGSSSSGSGGGTSVPSGITATDAARLYEAIAAMNVATQQWSNSGQPTTCDAIYAALLDANQQTTDPGEGSGDGQTEPGTDSGSGTTDPGDAEGSEPGDSGGSDSGSSDTGDSGADGDSADPGTSTGDAGSADSGDDGGSADPGSADTGSASDGSTSDGSDDSAEQLALVVDDITLDDITACGQAREDLLLANAVLTDYYQQLITTGTIAGDESETPTATPSTPSSSSRGSSTGSSSSSSSASVSARAVASAEADVLRAQQAVDAAETALSNADLVAPIAGTIGAISLSAGDSSSDGTVTIVGEGTALISVEVPLATRTSLSQGTAATVTPTGTAESLAGTVTSISVLETADTAGDNPTYTTVIAVDDPDQALKEGAKADVEIVTGMASDVLTVPASAVTPTGTGTGTVQVVESTSSGTAETVTVTTGVVGGGRVEIEDGLQEGQLVVLSDRTATIDSLTSSSTSTRRVTGFALPR